MRASRLGGPAPPAALTQPQKKVPKKRALACAKGDKAEKAEKATAPQMSNPKAHKRQMVVPPQDDFQGVFSTMEEHVKRDDRAALFASGLEAEGRNVQDVLAATKVLAYCAQLKDELPWYVSMQKFVAGSDGVYDFPDVPVMSRQALLPFLREPAPFSGERPCINLDREPTQPYEQGLVRCVAHRMSEAQLGPGKGFRLREMIFTAAADVPTTTIPDLCYLCHLWTGLCDAMRQRDKTAERARPDMSDAPDDTVVIINRFMVMVDQIGEYDRTKMLVSDKVGLGIWGPFPLFNEKNYVAVERKAGVPAHFDETPNLLFRLTPAVSPRIANSSQSTRNQSIRTHEPPLSGSVLP